MGVGPIAVGVFVSIMVPFVNDELPTNERPASAFAVWTGSLVVMSVRTPPPQIYRNHDPTHRMRPTIDGLVDKERRTTSTEFIVDIVVGCARLFVCLFVCLFGSNVSFRDSSRMQETARRKLFLSNGFALSFALQRSLTLRSVQIVLWSYRGLINVHTKAQKQEETPEDANRCYRQFWFVNTTFHRLLL